jgi:hypothetical protein
MSSAEHGEHGGHGANKRAQRVIIAVPIIAIVCTIVACVYGVVLASSGDWAKILPANLAAVVLSSPHASAQSPSPRMIKLPLVGVQE